MSLASKLVLTGSVCVSAGIILYVHVKQDYDMKQMHTGVLKDIERQKRKQIENTYRLQQQAELEKELRRESSMSVGAPQNT